MFILTGSVSDVFFLNEAKYSHKTNAVKVKKVEAGSIYFD